MPYPTPVTLRFVELLEETNDAVTNALNKAYALDTERKRLMYLITQMKDPSESEWVSRPASVIAH